MNDAKSRPREIIAPNAAKFAHMIGENRQAKDNHLSGRFRGEEFLKNWPKKYQYQSAFNWKRTERTFRSRKISRSSLRGSYHVYHCQ